MNRTPQENAAPAEATSVVSPYFDVDELAQEIRRVDGSNRLGAGALAEALLPFIERVIATQTEESIMRAAAGRATRRMAACIDGGLTALLSRRSSTHPSGDSISSEPKL